MDYEMDYEMDDMEFYEQRMLVEDWMYDEADWGRSDTDDEEEWLI